jgi:hypothetical protein
MASWVVTPTMWREGALASALSKVYIMLTPSIGFCGRPSTTSGAGMPAASRSVDEQA